MNIINLIIEYYFLRLFFGMFIFYILCKIIKKYLNIDIIDILKVGMNNVIKIFIYIRNNIKK